MKPAATEQPFEILLGSGFARRLHDRDALDTAYPWASLNPRRFPPELVLRARASWTEAAFNEHCTFLALGALLEALGAAKAPLSLLSMASRFPGEEVLHIELCGRLASALGGLVPRTWDPRKVMPSMDPSLTPRQRANELVVRICCVGESFSLPMLGGVSKAASHPLTRAVLRTIVEDEALHGRLGFLYLAWADDALSKAERDRLGRVATEALEGFAPLWQRLESRVVDGITSEGYRLEDVNALGWMDSESYRERALEAVQTQVLAPLARFGIRAKAP